MKLYSGYKDQNGQWNTVIKINIVVRAKGNSNKR